MRPSQLKPGTNPFLKVTEEKQEKVDENETEPSADDRLNDKEDAEAPKFVPLGSANVTPRTTAPAPAPAQPATSNSSSGFVFGQNLSERVVMQQNMNNGEAAPVDHSSTNGTTELLFTSAAASVKDNNQVRSQSMSHSNLRAMFYALVGAVNTVQSSHCCRGNVVLICLKL